MYKITPKTLFVGKNLVYLPSCHSTNDVAAEIIHQGQGFEGTCVATGFQTAGRGQRGANWQAAEGQNLLATFILHPHFLPPAGQFNLLQAVSVSVYQLLQNQGIDSKIKWPNDVIVNHKKVGGILIESSWQGTRLKYSLVGIGLNLNQQDFSYPQATSLRLETGRQFDVPSLLEQLAETLERNYLLLKNGGCAEIAANYHRQLFRLGQWHHFTVQEIPFEGKITGVTAEGFLELETRQGQLQTYAFKEIGYVF